MNTTMDVSPNDDAAEESTDEPAQTESPDDTDDDTTHLNDLPDGAGCAEVWEHLSENRDED